MPWPPNRHLLSCATSWKRSDFVVWPACLKRPRCQHWQLTACHRLSARRHWPAGRSGCSRPQIGSCVAAYSPALELRIAARLPLWRNAAAPARIAGQTTSLDALPGTEGGGAAPNLTRPFVVTVTVTLPVPPAASATTPPLPVPGKPYPVVVLMDGFQAWRSRRRLLGGDQNCIIVCTSARVRQSQQRAEAIALS